MYVCVTNESHGFGSLSVRERTSKPQLLAPTSSPAHAYTIFQTVSDHEEQSIDFTLVNFPMKENIREVSTQ
jgi:hypothetical protein